MVAMAGNWSWKTWIIFRIIWKITYHGKCSLNIELHLHFHWYIFAEKNFLPVHIYFQFNPVVHFRLVLLPRNLKKQTCPVNLPHPVLIRYLFSILTYLSNISLDCLLLQGYSMCVLNYNYHILDNAFLVHKFRVKLSHETGFSQKSFAVWTLPRIRQEIEPDIHAFHGTNEDCAKIQTC